MPATSTDNRGLLQALLGDGRFLLSMTGMALLGSGWFAIMQSLTGQLLPHDVQALGMDATALRMHTNQNLVWFMFHDRVAFEGTLLAIGYTDFVHLTPAYAGFLMFTAGTLLLSRGLARKKAFRAAGQPS